MAVFGRDFFGLTKYGSNVRAKFDVDPFDANPNGYGSIRVTWHSPTPAANWTAIRLLRSKSGYSVNPTDGLIVLDSTTSANLFVDTGLTGGSWYYYTLFIKDTLGVWNRAGATSSLAVKQPWTRPLRQVIGLQYETQQVPYGYADLMWERIPEYYKYVRRHGDAITDSYKMAPNLQAFVEDPDGYDQENQTLRALLNVLGYGLDYLHNYEDTLLSANDPHKAHLQDVNRLADTVGIPFEYGIPASVMRSKVANSALLARRRGTLSGLADVAALSTGWDVDVQVNQNLFLNRDQAEFLHPQYAEWDSGINYATGQFVQYEGRIFTCVGVPLFAPTSFTGTAVPSGVHGVNPGAWTPSTYYWKITGTDASGETTGSTEVTATLGATSLMHLQWRRPLGATLNGYRIYRGTSAGAENVLVATLNDPSALEYYDYGFAGTAGSVPVTNTTSVGAYGTAQRPPETGTNNNTWWILRANYDTNVLLNPVTDAVVTWKGWQLGTTQQRLAVALGVSDPISSAGKTSNALVVRSGTPGRAYDIVGAANTAGVGDTLLPTPANVITQGIPIPRAVLWNAQDAYNLGVIVAHHGSAWRAIGTSVGQEPGAGSIYWEKVGVDTRPLLAYSFYAHGEFFGTAGTGGVSVTPGLAFYDHLGGLLLDQTSLTALSNFVFDTFNHTFGTPDFTSYGNWTTTGTWDTEPLDLGDDPVAYPLSTGTAVLTVPGGLLQYRVAATFAKAAASGTTDAILLRYVDANNYMRVTRTKVEKMVAGVLSTVATLTGTTVDGDRVQVKIDDTANTFIVYRNLVSVASGPMTGGSSPYKHGMMVA